MWLLYDFFGLLFSAVFVSERLTVALGSFPHMHTRVSLLTSVDYEMYYTEVFMVNVTYFLKSN